MKKYLAILALLVVGTAIFAWGNNPKEENYSIAPTRIPIIPTTYSTPTPTTIPKLILHPAPFTSQAPFGEWNNSIFQDGCEEASSLIAVSWARKESLTPEKAKQAIMDISEYEQMQYGGAVDTSVYDTAERIIKGYFHFSNYQIIENITLEGMKEALYAGKIIIAPTNGKALSNPNFSNGGPDRHMLVVIGYDSTTREFITHDPGTRKGENYRYNQNVLYQAIRNYSTGDHAPIVGIGKHVIVIYK